ncbi:hypothetical protein [Pseudomonas sp. BGI-2]|uniref:hypothetical protein n=1 Tax=Pseudomonas sp. BGI-2 TaxID=2528211 RepID=UPI001033B1E8|nr:hypothetical protein [Pseudomonas sp. BGI-2]TBN49186.1 hypothetical protein EYC95_06505 [Pseudomonas sp. BGI-2]
MTEQEEFEFRMRLEQEQAAPSPEQSQVQAAQPQQEVAAQSQTPPDRLRGRNWLERGTLGAGKAVADLMEGVGLGGALWPRGWQRAPGADDDLMSDPAGIGGNIAGQVGIGVLGGKALQGAGKAVQSVGAARAMPVVKSAGGLLEMGGNAILNPTNYRQAAGAGAAFGLLTQPGDLPGRLANAATGAIGGTAGMAVGRGVGKVVSGVKSLITPKAPIEMEISAKLAQDGVDYFSLPKAIKEQMVTIGKRSLDDIGQVDTEQLSRMADFNKLGITPTRGWVTRDAKDWWMENNLNTVDDQIQARFVDANRTLLQGVSKGAGDATDYQRGQVLKNSVTGYDDALKKKADTLYQSARDTAGRDIPLDAPRFINNASADLDQQMLGSKLPADTLSWFKNATEGKEPFDMGTALQRLQALNGRIYSTSDRAEATALGIVKNHLIKEIEGNGDARSGGQKELADAFQTARTAAADRFRFQESNPLIDKILKGKYAPEDLPEIVGRMKVDDLNGLSQLEAQRGVPIMGALRDSARAYIRDASTLQSETGGSFTINGMRKAIDKIGPEKGKALFGKEGWEEYLQILRAGGAINNPPMKPAGSSTAPNLLRMMQQLPIPGIPQSLNLVFSGIGKAKQMSNVGAALNPSIKMSVPRTPQPSILPLITAPGLLGISEQ